MHKRTLKKLALLLTFWVALHSSSLKAQIFTAPLQASTTGTNPVDFEFRADGTMIAIGNSGVGSLLSTDQGDGTRLLWFPSLGAFRAGTVSTGDSIGTGPWDAPQLGQYSAAFGCNTLASGTNSVAFGYGSQASGSGSTATGWEDTASGDYSVALGGANNATGHGSTAMGSLCNSGGEYSYAAGCGTLSSGFCSTALGCYSTASGNNSTASGYGNVAYNSNTFAAGAGSTAYGVDSVAMGTHVTASAFYSFALGTYNVGGGSLWGWVATDPLFEIGNGTSTTPSDALVVYKNGNAVLQGTLDVAAGGDIPMYSGE